MGLDCRLERLEPTEYCSSYQNILDNVHFSGRNYVTDIPDRIKEEIGTTRVNSSVGLDCRLERLEPTSVIALLSDGCKKAVPPIKHRVAIMSNPADEQT